ncbi:hypothetical protein [Fictibacillus gelatini]|uniref:hypothetical protein n=1 Tax=Fictibacillus gelatini TaxID=225985 RepID=UPI0004289F58|nr:hypothetical protein [Fictibacillus gelatini]
MNIYDALKTLKFHKQQFFKYHFKIWFDSEKEMTEEELLKTTNRHSMNGFYRWMKTEEWKHLVALYLSSKTAEDLIAMYNSVKEKALTGDEKAVKLLLQLQKEIEHHRQLAVKAFNNVVQDEEDDDDLEL